MRNVVGYGDAVSGVPDTTPERTTPSEIAPAAQQSHLDPVHESLLNASAFSGRDTVHSHSSTPSLTQFAQAAEKSDILSAHRYVARALTDSFAARATVCTTLGLLSAVAMGWGHSLVHSVIPSASPLVEPGVAVTIAISILGTLGTGVASFASGRQALQAWLAPREKASSEKFETAQKLHQRALFDRDLHAAALSYLEAVEGAGTALQVKCGYGLLDIVRHLSDPHERGSLLAQFVDKASPNLVGTHLLAHVAQQLRAVLPYRLSDGLFKERMEAIRSVEMAHHLAYPDGFQNNEVAASLLTLSDSLRNIPHFRHRLLMTAFRTAVPQTDIQDTIGEWLIGNAQSITLPGNRLIVLKHISLLQGLPRDCRSVVAGQLQALLPDLPGEDVSEVHALIKGLGGSSPASERPVSTGPKTARSRAA